MDDAVHGYVERVPPEYRPLFERVHGLILGTCPDATVSLSYDMPRYSVGRRRMFVGVWAHGLSLYGWSAGRDGGFLARHPELVSGKGTIRLRPQDAAVIPDDELRDLVRGALAE